MYDRWYASQLREKLTRPFVHLIFGARQTGKTTLLRALLPKGTVVLDLSDPAERGRDSWPTPAHLRPCVANCLRTAKASLCLWMKRRLCRPSLTQSSICTTADCACKRSNAGVCGAFRWEATAESGSGAVQEKPILDRCDFIYVDFKITGWPSVTRDREQSGTLVMKDNSIRCITVSRRRNA